MPFDKQKNQRKGFCFITFDSEQVVNELLKTPKQTISGKEVDVKKATPKPDNMHMGGPMGGRGGMRGPPRGGMRGGRGGPGGPKGELFFACAYYVSVSSPKVASHVPTEFESEKLCMTYVTSECKMATSTKKKNVDNCESALRTQNSSEDVMFRSRG